MKNKKLVKGLIILSLSTIIASLVGYFAFFAKKALQSRDQFSPDSNGEKYSGWFIDSKGDRYYFEESDKKTGWYFDETGDRYYLNLSDGKMETGWNTIDGKDYFFQPVNDMEDYHFNNEQEKCLSTLNSNVPYGAMYKNTTSLDGHRVDENGIRTNIDLEEYIGSFYCDYSEFYGSEPNTYYGIFNIERTLQNKIYGTLRFNYKEENFEADFTSGVNVSENGVVSISGVRTVGEESGNYTTDIYLAYRDEVIIVTKSFSEEINILKKISETEDISVLNEVKNGWILENGNWYYYEANEMAKDKWLYLSDKWYYVMEDGVMVSNGWKEINGKSYYFDSDGAMYVNTTTPDGYRVDENGAKVTNGYLDEYVGIFYEDYSSIYSAEPGTYYGIIYIRNVSPNKIYGSLGFYYGEGCFEADFTNGATVSENRTVSITGTLSEDAGINSYSEDLYFSYADGVPMISNSSNEAYKQVSTAVLEGAFVCEGEQYESYQCYMNNSDTIDNFMEDKRSQGIDWYECIDLLHERYPELPNAYWEEWVIDGNTINITAEQYFTGRGMAYGNIIWIGNNTATIIYNENSYGYSEKTNLKVLDSNTILINDEKYIKIR